MEHYREAAKLLPKFTQAHLGLALSALKLGKNEEAVTAYEAAAELEPELPEPYLGLGRLHDQQSRKTLAIEAYRKFLERWKGEHAVAEIVRKKIKRLLRTARPQ